MPNAASGLAKLSVRDPHEPEAPRVKQHLLERHPTRRLLIGSRGDRRARALDAPRELVPDALELAEVEQSRCGVRPRGLLVEPSHREGGHERIGQLPLELVDLRPQSPARRPLVLSESDCRASKDRA
jgi:hypothetical protein